MHCVSKQETLRSTVIYKRPLGISRTHADSGDLATADPLLRPSEAEKQNNHQADQFG